MADLHFLQLEILKKLLFSPELSFSELRPFDYVENNQLTFHIDQLERFGHIEKLEKKYRLTKSGKEFANRMDTDSAQMKKQGKIGVITCCMNNTKDELEFLLYTRLKHPFYGSQGYSSGKVWYGEQVAETAKRELKEETNLDGEPQLFMIEHHIVYDKTSNELLEDKYFYFHRFINPTGELISNNEGKFEWIKESKLKEYFVKPFETVERLMYITERIKDVDAELTYIENTHYTDKF